MYVCRMYVICMYVICIHEQTHNDVYINTGIRDALESLPMKQV